MIKTDLASTIVFFFFFFFNDTATTEIYTLSLHDALPISRYYGLRILSWVVFAFLVGTVLATVYLGWHFAVDDVAGIAIAWVAVQLGKLTVNGTWRSPTHARASI